MKNPSPGLCLLCKNVKVIRSDRGSVFYLCELAQSDKSFKKYPPIPVLNCRGYENKDEDDEEKMDEI